MAADPYLAVTLDAKRRIARAALAIGADPAVWTLGYLNLMEHVWERKDARVSALVIAACFGPDPRAPAALVEFGFLVVAGEVWDLNPDDTDRLLLTYKQRVAAGKARAESAVRDEKGRVQRATSGQPAEHQRTSSGPPAASQLLHPAPSTQQKEEDLPRAPPAGPVFGPEELRADYNAVAKPLGLVMWVAMPQKRLTAAKARLREHPEREWWATVLQAMAASAFIRGETGDRTWRGNPDFLLTPGRAESILEGKYSGGAQQALPAPVRKAVLL